MSKEDNLVLWHSVIKRQGNYVFSSVGEFIIDEENVQRVEENHNQRKKTKRRELQVCLATQTHIDIYDVGNGMLEYLGSWAFTGTILQMEKLNVEGCKRSLLALVTDSGNFSCLRFRREVSEGRVYMETLCNEPFSRSGVRRLSPQSSLEADLHGRCMLLSGTERSRLCFLTDWQRGQLVVSSGVEMKRHGRFQVSTTVCDTSFDNPVFASIEMEGGTGDVYLSFYVMDLGLNHMVVGNDVCMEDKTLSFILGCPNLQPYGIGTRDERTQREDINPFVLCGFDGYISLRDMEGFYDVSVQLPSRKDTTSTIIVSGTIHKLKKDFFILLQSNHGDLYKVSIIPENDTGAPVMRIAYFDTIPVSESLHIFKSGSLLSLSEFGTSYLTQFESLGEDLESLTSHAPGKRLIFKPNSTLQNLSILDSLKTLNPLSSFHVMSETPLSIVVPSSRGISKLTSAVPLETLISTPLPRQPNNLWTIKLRHDSFHTLLFLSMNNSTTVLKIQGGTVEDFNDETNPFVLKRPTVFVGVMGISSIIQVTPDSMRQVVREGNTPYVNKLEWVPPAGVTIQAASCNDTQLILSLSSHEICYFEIQGDSLNELQNRLDTDVIVTSIALDFEARSDFCVLGCEDSSLKVVSLKRNDEAFFEICSMQSLLSKPQSLLILRDKNQVTVHIGMKNGVYMNSKLNTNDGSIYDVQRKLVGSKPVNLSILRNMDLKYLEQDADEDEDREQKPKKLRSFITLNSSKSWVTYESDGRTILRPLLIDSKGLKTIVNFMTDDIKQNGCCSISSNGQLIIGRINKLLTWDHWFNEEWAEKKDVNTLDHKQGCKDGFEHLSLSHSDAKYRSKDVVKEETENEENEEENEEEENDDDEEEEEEDICEFFEYSKQTIVPDNVEKGIVYLLANQNQSLEVSVIQNGVYLETDNNCKYTSLSATTFLSACSCSFGTNNKYLILATLSDELKVLQIKTKNNTFSVHVVHETQIGQNLNAIIQFKDKVACILNNMIVLYGLGKKQLLKKCISSIPPHITKAVSLDQWNGKILAIGDVRESVTLFEYDELNNNFKWLADDISKRHVTALKFLDGSTIIGGDKFGNAWVLRVNYEVNARVSPNIDTCQYKLETICHFYLNDIPMRFEIVNEMNMSDRPSVVWAGIQGTIGCFVPLVTKKEQQIFKTMQNSYSELDMLYFEDHYKPLEANAEEMEGALDETNLVNEKKSLVEGSMSRIGRNFNSYRGYYAPVKNVIDGESLEQIFTHSPAVQKWISKKLSKNRKDIGNINRYINEMRTNHL